MGPSGATTKAAILPVEPTAALPLGLNAVDQVEITTVCDNVIDILLVDEGPARRFRMESPEQHVVEASMLEGCRTVAGPVAQHGFSALVTVRRGHRSHSLLLDTGATPDGCVENMRRLEIDPHSVEAIVLSHGHYDHTTGLSGLAPVLGPSGVPIVAHPDAFLARRVVVGNNPPRPLVRADREALAAAGFVVHENGGPSLLFEATVLVTGAVPRRTDFELGLPVQQAYAEEGWRPDPEVNDDQAVVVHVAGRGLVVVTGCGHAGIVNIARHARELVGVDRLHCVIGGFHLGGPMGEQAIAPTVEALCELAPDVIVPTHCTGWRAIHEIARELPDAFIQNSVGTTFELGPSVGA